MGVQTFHLFNASGQGIVLSFYVNGISQTHTINAGEEYEFEASSLSPETQNAIQMGYLVYLQGSATVFGSIKAGFPLVYRRNYYPTVKYKTGDLILFNGSLWLCDADVYGQTPIDNTGAWTAFLNDIGSGNHQFDTDNPHQVTAVQTGAIPASEKGASDGVAPLVDGKLPSAYLPDASVANGDTKLAEGTPNEVSASALRLHLDSLNNPHQTTPAQIGAVPLSQVGHANGVAPLDNGGLIPAAYLPASSGGTGLVPVYAVDSLAERDALASSLSAGSLVAVLQSTAVFRWSGVAFVDTTATAMWVFHVNGKTGPTVELTTDDIDEANGKYYFTDVRLASSSGFLAVQAVAHTANSDTKLANGTGNEVTAVQLKAHLTSTSNPHSVTAAQIGALTSLSEDVAPALGNAMDAATFRIFNLGTPTGDDDAATKGYVDNLVTIAAGGGVLTVNTRAGAVTLTIADVPGTATALRTAITGTTGTDNLVFSTAPTLASPVITGTIKQATGVNAITFSTTGTPVNYFDFGLAGTGNGPTLSATGTDANVILNVKGKGAAPVKIAGLATDVAVLDVNTTLTAAQTVIGADAAGGNLTFTLPGAAANPGKIFSISKVDATANTVTITSSDPISGGTLVLGEQWESAVIQAMGGAWVIIASHDLGTGGGGGGTGWAAPTVVTADAVLAASTQTILLDTSIASGSVLLNLPLASDGIGPITVILVDATHQGIVAVADPSGDNLSFEGATVSSLFMYRAGDAITLEPGPTGSNLWVVKSDNRKGISTVPPVSGNNGKILVCNGTSSDWSASIENLTISGLAVGTVDIDTTGYLQNYNTTIRSNATAGNILLYLPDATTVPGKIYSVVKTDASVNTVLFDADGAQLINGSATLGVSQQNQVLTIQAVGTGWVVLSAFNNLGTGLQISGNLITIDSTVATLNGSQTLNNKTLNTPTLIVPQVINNFAVPIVVFTDTAGNTATGGSLGFKNSTGSADVVLYSVFVSGADKSIDVQPKGAGLFKYNGVEIATTTYVSSAVTAALNGLSWKTVCRAASTADITLASGLVNGVTIDGVTLATGDRVLVKDQSTPSQNGIYIVAASGAASRAADADSGVELVNASVFIAEGTVAADKQYVCTTNGTITLGSTSITFTNFAGGGSAYLNGTGILLTGLTFSIDTSVTMDLTTAQSASNKTFVSPKINEIRDTNGNELIIFTTTASAVNEWTWANAATGNGPTITVSGGDTNIDGTIQAKGTGSVILPKAKITAATIALHADAYVELTSSRAATNADNGKILWSSAAYTLTIPDSLTKPFGCTLKQEGSGAITVAVSGTAVLHNIDTHTKTGGQWTMASIDYRTGNDVVLSGRTAA